MSIAQQALSWPEIRRLMSVPGVNLICAAPFIAAIGRANRFMTSRKPVAYLGLDPKVLQSGQARPAPAGRPNADRRFPGGGLVEAARRSTRARRNTRAAPLAGGPPTS